MMNPPNYGALIFCTDLAKQLEETYRIPPTSIGVRRVRPSRKVVLDALNQDVRSRKSQKDASPMKKTSPILQDKKGNSNESLSEQKPSNQVTATNDNLDSLQADIPSDRGYRDHAVAQKTHYHQLEMNPRLLQEELSELKGANSTVVPVFLSYPMALQAHSAGILPNVKLREEQNLKGFANKRNHSHCFSLSSRRKRKIRIHNDLASRWAKLLKESMAQAETDRDNEQMRPMAYTLMPEVWSRLRPPVYDNIQYKEVPINSTQKVRPAALLAEVGVSSSRTYREKCFEIIYECLYQHFPNLYISCGVKFGCDYLLYDGCRKERHAFAGLRVCITEKEGLEFALPTAFDLSGYVRLLNTTGKLALLAMMKEIDSEKEETPTFHVAFVDLALEKVLTAPSHQRKRSRKRSRKEVGLHLEKKSK